MDKVQLLAHIASLLQDSAVANDGRVGDGAPVVLSVSFDCDHKSAELFVLTNGKQGRVEYCISTGDIKDMA